MKVTKRYLKKLIKENIKSLNEISNHLQVSEPFDQYKEISKAKEFAVTPPSHEIVVEQVLGQINDDYVRVEINMSNGDKIISDYKKTTIYYTSPNFTVKQKFEKNMEYYWGSTNTVIGDILLVYKDFIIKGYH